MVTEQECHHAPEYRVTEGYQSEQNLVSDIDNIRPVTSSNGYETNPKVSESP